MPKSSSRSRRPRQRSDADRRIRQATRFASVLRVLELIQSRGRWNVSTLAEELECSPRTVHRYLQILEVAGVPYFFDEASKCYRVRPDFRFPTVNLTADDAWSQAIAAQLAKTPSLGLSPGAESVSRKLAVNSSEEIQDILVNAEQLITILGLKFVDHRPFPEFLKSVQWALLQRKQLAATYESPYEAKAVRLQLHPYRLCLVKQAWYLIARANDDTSPRTYRIARFKSLRMLDHPAQVPAEFDLQDFFGNAWAVYRGERRYEVGIKFFREVAKVVTETVWHHTQKVKRHRDGSVTLSFVVDGLEEITNWILTWAGRCRILGPPELIEIIRGRLQQALADLPPRSEAKQPE